MPAKSKPGRPATEPATPLGAAIRRARGKRRVEDLAAACGVAVQTWWRWERGERQPALDQLCAIAAALGVSVARLLKQSSD